MNRDEALKKSDDALKELAESLKQGKSDALLKYLSMLSRFHRYSFGNCMLIALQRPEASLVAGFHRWKELHRWVKKDEHGIAILAPMIGRRKKDADSAGNTERPAATNDDESESRVIRGFRVAYVFDVEQTEGKELTEFAALGGERVLILKDGEPDHWMAENWNQLVDDLIPFGVAQLCFFDAEKIRFLAEDETSNVALGDAIKALLGLDLAERLVADSTVLEGRLAKKIKKSDDLEALTKLEESWREKKANVERLKQDRAGIVPQLERAQSRAQKAEANFAKVGGKHWEQREQRTQQKGELQTTVQHCEESLVNLASGALPLSLVDDLLGQVAEQAQRERSAAESGFLTSLLSKRDKDLLKALKSAKASDDVVKVASEFLDKDRQKRASADDVEAWLDLPDVSARRLDELLESGLTKRLEESVELLTRLEDAQRDLENVERSLAAAPKEDAIKDVAAELKAATSEAAELRQQFNRIEAELKPVEFEVAELEKQIAKLRHKSIDEQMSHDQNARVGALVRRTQDTMREFLRRATERKIARLSDLVTTSFRYLLRKQQLVERVVIDPTDFSITLVDQSGAVLPKERLSEGEKQIFAISVLWGLSQASARPLPAIIDTPMGRLDSEHRNQLVERYFPHASHQVIILSTDTEIEVNYFERLQPSVARAYHLNYDESGRMTNVEEGYFWKAADAKVTA